MYVFTLFHCASTHGHLKADFTQADISQGWDAVIQFDKTSRPAAGDSTLARDTSCIRRLFVDSLSSVAV